MGESEEIQLASKLKDTLTKFNVHWEIKADDNKSEKDNLIKALDTVQNALEDTNFAGIITDLDQAFKVLGHFKETDIDEDFIEKRDKLLDELEKAISEQGGDYWDFIEDLVNCLSKEQIEIRIKSFQEDG